MRVLDSMRQWLALVLVLAAGCGPKICTLNFVFGLSVNVEDAQGMPVCDVTVRIRDGAYDEERALEADSCSFSGAGERPGTYQVAALRDGVVVAETQVSVSANECHVEGRTVTLRTP